MTGLWRSERGSWLPPLLLASLATAGAAPVLRRLFVPDLNWCYPFMTPDSYDWIANGLSLAGVPVGSTWRPPGLPLVIAILWKIGALSVLPAVNYFVLAATTAALYRLLRERFPPGSSALAAWIFFTNDYVQDLTKYVMAEIYCTFFLVLAARAFYLAAREPRRYRWFGLWLGMGFIFHHAALIAGVGFVIALFVTRREHLGRRELWQALVVSCFIAGTWLLARWIHYRRAGGLRHLQEELVRFSPENIRFYTIAGAALLGLALLPLYAAGFLRTVGGNARTDRAFRATELGPLLSLALFWVLLYDWADKRFLYYLFPFCACLLAEGLSALFDYARRGLAPRAIAVPYLAAALLWNVIRYPSYGINFLALTPRDFLVCPTEPDVGITKTLLHINGARVVRLHATLLEAFSDGLFDYRQRAATCDLQDPSYSCLARLKHELDSWLPRETPVGLGRLQAYPDEIYLYRNRIGNEIQRRTVPADEAELFLTSVSNMQDSLEFACGPYRLLRRAIR